METENALEADRAAADSKHIRHSHQKSNGQHTKGSAKGKAPTDTATNQQPPTPQKVLKTLGFFGKRSMGAQ